MFKVGDKVRFKTEEELKAEWISASERDKVHPGSTLDAMNDGFNFDDTYKVIKVVKGVKFNIHIHPLSTKETSVFSPLELNLVKPYSIKGLYDV